MAVPDQKEVYMAKYIIRDFFFDFRMSRVKQNKVAYTCFWMSFYLILTSLFVNRVGISGAIAWRNVIAENALMLPMIFSFCSVMVHPVQLPKMMYLCPMAPEERRAYIYGSYWFRVGVNMLVGMAGLCIVASYSDCDLMSAVQILMNHALIAVQVSHRQQVGSRNGVVAAGEIISVTALLSNAVQFIVLLDLTRGLWIRGGIFFIFCFVQLPLQIWYAKYIRSVLREAVFYAHGHPEEDCQHGLTGARRGKQGRWHFPA